MTKVLQLPKSLLPYYCGGNVRGAAAERKRVLNNLCKSYLEGQGYLIGDSLKIPAATAFKAEKDGEKLNVGIKTSADRWLNANRTGDDEWGLLSHVDELFVITMDPSYTQGMPTKVQIYKFDPRDIIAAAEKVELKKGREDQEGQIFMPLDVESTIGSKNVGCAGGALIPNGELVSERPVSWLNNRQMANHLAAKKAAKSETPKDEDEAAERVQEAAEAAQRPLGGLLARLIAAGTPVDLIEEVAMELARAKVREEAAS